MKKIALITGATSGIGKACALLLAKNNFDIIITGRRKNLLLQLAQQLEESGAMVLTLNFDVQNKLQTDEALDSMPDAWKNIDLLINNAGLAAGADKIYEAEVSDWEAMIDTNVKGLLYVSRKIIPGMISQKSGHIINIGSVAGKEVYMNGSVYCASKHAVDALTKAMRIELLPFGIKVTQISPGAVETEFSMVRFKGDNSKADAVYANMDPLMANDIAETVWFAVSRPPHVNLNDIWIMPTMQANTSHIFRRPVE